MSNAASNTDPHGGAPCGSRSVSCSLFGFAIGKRRTELPRLANFANSAGGVTASDDVVVIDLQTMLPTQAAGLTNVEATRDTRTKRSSGVSRECEAGNASPT